MKKATIADVAELAGVSKATVSRFLKQENVREEIAERIRAAIQETGYVARGSKANKTNEKTTEPKGEKSKTNVKAKQRNYRFGMLVKDITLPRTRNIIQALKDVLREQNITFSICITDGVEELEEKYLTSYIVQNVNGILVESCSSTEFIQKQMRTTSIPVLFLHEKKEQLNSCCFHEVQAGEVLGAYMLKKEQLIVRYLGTEQELAEQRLQGIRNAYHEKRQPIDLKLCLCDGSYGDIYEKIKEVNPGLIYVAISGFGRSKKYEGPYAKRLAYDIIAQAMAGLMYTCGSDPQGPPTWLGFALGDSGTGVYAAYAAMLGYVNKLRTGKGEYFDVSMYDCMVALAERSHNVYAFTGNVVTRGPDKLIAPWGPFKCKDGYVAIIVPTESMWKKFLTAIGHLELLENPEIQSGPGRGKYMETLIRPIINEWLADKTKVEACEIFMAQGLPRPGPELRGRRARRAHQEARDDSHASRPDHRQDFDGRLPDKDGRARAGLQAAPEPRRRHRRSPQENRLQRRKDKRAPRQEGYITEAFDKRGY